MAFSYGYIPDLRDHRDIVYKAPFPNLALPPRVDLRPICPPTDDQGTLGSCTAAALAKAHRFLQMKFNSNHFMPSRLFIYYNERKLEGTIAIDAGAQIRSGIKSIAKQGCPPESVWPYVVERFRQEPSMESYSEALNNQAIVYQRVTQSHAQMQGCIAAGYPFVFGFSVYESFESVQVTRTGMMPMPERRERLQGGHAVMCVGYDTESRLYIVQNSWSIKWGDKGFFYMPFDFMVDPNFVQDIWVMQEVEVANVVPSAITTTTTQAPIITTQPPDVTPSEYRRVRIGREEIFVNKDVPVSF